MQLCTLLQRRRIIVKLIQITFILFHCLATYVYLNFPLLNRESPAHGNFHFIGPGLAVMCQSIKEKVLSLSDDSKIRTIKKGQILRLLCYYHSYF